MNKIIKYLKPKDWLFIIFALGLIVLQVWLDLTLPEFTEKLTTSIYAGTANMNDVMSNGGMMLLCAFGSMAGAIVCTLLCAKVGGNYAMTLRSKMFPHIMKFSNSEMNKFTIPSLITRTTNDVVQMQSFLANGMQILFKAPILAIWAISKISVTAIEWTSATIISVIILITFVSILVALCYPKFKKIQKLTDDLNDTMRENVSGVKVIRAFNAEDYQERKFGKVNTAVYKNNIFTSRTLGLMMPIMLLIMNGLTLAIYWIGAYLINNAEVMARPEIMGNMTAFVSYALQVVMAFIMLIAIFIILPRVLVSAKRIGEVMATETSIKDGENVQKSDSQNLKGVVEFKNVCFSYSDSEHAILKNLTFKVDAGETVAIIGPTGSAKTTLINLMARNYDVTSGEVLIDGKNVKDIDLQELRDKIGYATQKAVLFRGTVRSNMLYGNNKTATDEDIQRALKIANADFVLQSEDGLETKVAQGGSNFSGGQKQRLSIARVLCKNSEIIVFDDSFSALDYKTDLLVRKAIKENLNSTIFIIAQRIGTVKSADKIIVLDDGKIVGMGTHDFLMEHCEMYKDIALSQLTEQELVKKEDL